MRIRETTSADLQTIEAVERAAFHSDIKPRLAADLLFDPTAHPLISLLAFKGEEPAGHILLTRVGVESKGDLSGMILAPLAVVPTYQRQGFGQALIRKALEMALELPVDLVFVLGSPQYYPKVGFQKDAGALGFMAPYPIEARNKDAWMVLGLTPGVLGKFTGRVRCAESLMKPELWRE